MGANSKSLLLQESDGQKTNNGIHYRLQLLYASGKQACIYKLNTEYTLLHVIKINVHVMH